MSQEALQRGLIEPKNCASEHFGLQHGALEGLGKLCKTRRHRARTAYLSGHAQLRHWESGPSGSPGSGLRDCGGGPTKSRCCQRRSSSSQGRSLIHVVLMLTAESRNRKCRDGPHVLPPGSRAIETLPTGGEHKTRRRRRPQRGGEHNHDPTTTTSPRSAMPAGWLSTTTGEDRSTTTTAATGGGRR